MSGDESLSAHFTRSVKNLCITSLFCFNKTKYQTLIQKIKVDISSRKKDFGVEYLDLKKKGVSDEDLNAATEKALADIAALEEKIAEYQGDIEKAREEKEAQTLQSPTKATSTPAPVAEPTPAPAPAPATEPAAAAEPTPTEEPASAAKPAASN